MFDFRPESTKRRKIIVYHSYYGCDTGCCGHVINVDGSEPSRFEFVHPSINEDLLTWAKALVMKELGPEHVQDLDWENCKVVSFEKCSG